MKAVVNKKVKNLLWRRLSTPLENLNLDSRINEQPFDYFVRLASAGSRKDIVLALRSLLAEVDGDAIEAPEEEVRRFLSQALPLCDSLAAEECRDILKALLLLEEGSGWKRDLNEIQELAARSLVGLSKRPSDLRFWADLAQKLDGCLPYALNAVVEIDLDHGLRLLCDTLMKCLRRRMAQIVDWSTVFYLAIERHGETRVREALRAACADYPDSVKLHEYIAREIAEAPGLSRMGHLTLDELVPEVATPPPGVSMPARVDQEAVLDLGRDYASLLGKSMGHTRLETLSGIAEGYAGRRAGTRSTPYWLRYGPQERGLT